MKRILVGCFLMLAAQGYASLTVYGVGELGIMRRQSNTEKFINVEKFGGGLGLEFALSFFSIGAEVDYVRGVSTDPIPHKYEGKISRSSYGSFQERGINFVKVHYFDLWIRPKILIPIPFVQPYLVIPLSPFSFGGMQGYSQVGVGLGAHVGVQVQIVSFALFVESGFLGRPRKGAKVLDEKPPWPMWDFSVPIRLGLGYSF